MTVQVLVKRHGEVETNVSAAENISAQLVRKIDTDLSENRTFVKKHASVIKLNTSLVEEAAKMQSEMKQTIDEVEVYHERTNEYQKWLEVSLQAPALNEPIGNETSVIKRQLGEVEVRALYIPDAITCQIKKTTAIFPPKEITVTAWIF